MIAGHLPNVLTYFRHRNSNAMAEGLNSKVATIQKARLWLPQHRSLQDRRVLP
jgi:transposase